MWRAKKWYKRERRNQNKNIGNSENITMNQWAIGQSASMRTPASSQGK